MIEKMSKLYLIMRNVNIEEILDKLQALGVMHIEKKSQDTIIPKEDIDLEKKISFYLKYINDSTIKIGHQSIYNNNLNVFLDEFKNLLDEFEDIKQKEIQLRKIESILSPWGNVDKKILQTLKTESKLIFDYYILSSSQYDILDLTDIPHQVINQNNDKIYLVTIQRSNDTKSKLPIEKLVLPDHSLDECQKELDEILTKKQFITKKIDDTTEYYNYLSASHQKIVDRINFFQIKGETKDYHESFSSLVGWVPGPTKSEVTDFLNKTNNLIYILDDEITEEESANVPILLKNNKFNQLFEPITKLFMLPAYVEMDLTPFFAPFFVMFFGICLGDSVYGLFMFSACVIAYFKVKSLRPFLVLGMFLGLSTIFWGILSGTFVGINVFETKIPVISDMAVFNSQHMFVLSLLIGLLQILFGMLVQCINRWIRHGFQAALAPFGWFLVVLFGTFYYMNSSINTDGSTFKIGNALVEFSKSMPLFIQKGGIGIGILLILFFNDIKANIFVRLGKGLWELYGITGVFGDLLSYIRLFALGISSAILGFVINSIGKEFLNIPIPVVSHIIFFLFVTIGHIANLGLASLGSFVHPLRLTFVEFYKNAGFEGGGIEYNPFKKIYTKKIT